MAPRVWHSDDDVASDRRHPPTLATIELSLCVLDHPDVVADRTTHPVV
jgi:hypothetical protein